MQLIAIDPGLGGTGLALWDTDICRRMPQATTTIRPSRKETDTPSRCLSVAVQVRNWVLNHTDTEKNTVAVLEEPEYFPSAGGAMAAVAGDVVKLTLVAAYVASFLQETGVVMKFYPVRTWKGQLPKEITVQRVREYTKREFSSHIADAVALGLWFLNKESWEWK